jgi:hypothetical protein
MNVVNVFLPTMKGTKLSFMRDVLADKKLHLKQNEVIRLDIPAYQELSVKNLYEDALKDPVLTKYLPTKEQLSNKLPEREFFFGVLCTLRKQYMKDIIQAASNKRFKVSDDDPKRQGIAITDGWFTELMKHPYHSSKQPALNLVEKPGTGIFLMKESAKLYKQQRKRTSHTLSKRLQQEEVKEGDLMQDDGVAEKKKKLADGSAMVIDNPPKQMMQSSAKPK